MADFLDKALSEEDIKNQRITPVLLEKKWKREQIRMEYAYTAGEIRVDGNMTSRKKKKFIDYLLFDDENYPIAIIEAKSAKYHHSRGLQQAKEYAKELSDKLDVPFVFSSNGEKFRMYSKYLPELEKTLEMDEFPTLEELKALYMEGEKYTPEQLKLINQPYYTHSDSFPPRYYQRIAINKTIEALAKGKRRAMVVMATGTGKTYVAFQIIYRYLQQNPKARILYLADRNILIDQTMRQDFKPFAKIMTKVQGKRADTSKQIYMSLYGQWVKYEDEIQEGEKQPYEDYEKDFFDLIMIDECHRSSVKDDSQWKAILKYFDSAIQIGMTATPRDAKGGSNIEDFGEPVFTYSLIQGIQDGYLAPYRVVKDTINSDVDGYVTEADERDLSGRVIDKSLFTRQSFGREIQIKKRQLIVAKRITELLAEIGDMTKTIVFCPDEEEANVMRELLIDLNRAKCRKDDRYIVRITSSDRVGKSLLDDFIDPYSDYPVIATTSMLLSTGVDCKTCGLIVIDKEVGSMTTFKQMVGRGTRIFEKRGKSHFHILDFRDVSNKFFEEGFDKITDETEIKTTHKPKTTGGGDNGGGDTGGGTDEPRKYYVEGNEVTIINEVVRYINTEGKLVNEKLSKLAGEAIRKHYPSLDIFRGAWHDADKKKAILDELKDDVWFDVIREKYPQYKDWDEFDIVCHLAYDAPALTRQERINHVKKRNCFTKYGTEAKRIIDALLDKYAETGVVDIEDTKILEIPAFAQFGRKAKIMRLFNGLKGYEDAIQEIETEIYNIG